MLPYVLWSALAGVAPVSVSSAVVATEQACLTAAETRDFVSAHKVAALTVVQRAAAQHVRAEPLRSRLCHWNDEYLYEVTLLRRDGKVLRVFVRSTDGVVVPQPAERLR